MIAGAYYQMPRTQGYLNNCHAGVVHTKQGTSSQYQNSYLDLVVWQYLSKLEVDKVAGMVAKMADDKKIVLDWHVVEHGGQHGVHHVSRQKKLFLADMELDMVADMEVDKVAAMIKIKWDVLKRSVLGRSCLMQSVPDLRVF